MPHGEHHRTASSAWTVYADDQVVAGVAEAATTAPDEYLDL
jgi:hypothetical protein